jgi:dihydroorotate dehydrogenase electron transfer subunit
MLEQTVTIVANERDTDQYFRLVLHAPQIAPLIQPGQFAHVRILPLKDALLRRPFSIFQATTNTFSILYKTVGKGTDALARMRAGEALSVIAPLGHGFTIPKAGGETPLLVAGGYGMAAMFLLAQRSPQKGIVFVGGRRRVDILCEKEFAAIGWEVRVATEDGSHGEKGLVTQPLLAEIRNSKSQISNFKLFACGPTPMLKAVGKLAEEHDLPAELSMDEHMCCGVGTCLTCVIPVKAGDTWEYQRTCTEGPVFDARNIVWEITK